MSQPPSPNDLRNLGPTSKLWLEQVGVKTRHDLLAIGVVPAFLMVRQLGVAPSLNLLWALHGAAAQIDWREINGPDKARLLAELKALEA